MRKHILTLVLYVSTTVTVFAQWTANGDNVTIDKNIGIGTTTPTVKLDVNGDIKANSLYLSITEWNQGWGYSHIYYPGHSLVIGSREGISTHNALDMKPGGSTTAVIPTTITMWIAHAIGDYEKKVQIRTQGHTYFNGGNVGIGTENPQNKLDVLGTIRATEVKVESAWADFVFDKDYKLPTLQEVEAHINEYQRLPDIPSEQQVKEEGINIGEMQAKLLQKIEVLTLYVIEQNNRIEKQNEEIETLKNIISTK